ncbi:hypothetical protein DERF_012414 [Dermatophagoides farinae]|uniref:Uncharacterized protein n=1 Tax=Dermatophagoides farinae TaxID=6954 RepID=A0A922L3F1_DERFA|nr:hypothetical protein DERF_012414 [Dermatophagoides farinae]
MAIIVTRQSESQNHKSRNINHLTRPVTDAVSWNTLPELVDNVSNKRQSNLAKKNCDPPCSYHQTAIDL